EVDGTRDLRELRGALRVPRLEDLDDARQAVRDVGTGDTAGVEGPHRQLRARLADRLRGADADRVADLRHLAGGEERAVTRLPDVAGRPRQVARVGGAERRVGEALAGTVSRDEVLEHGQALHEVRLDRALDDLALRIRHQSAHAGELTELRERSAGARVGHHVDRVQLVQVLDHRLGDLLRRLRPDVHDRLVTLGLGDEAVLIGLLDLLYAVLVLGEDLLLLRRDDDVVLRDRDAGLRAVVEAEILD